MACACVPSAFLKGSTSIIAILIASTSHSSLSTCSLTLTRGRRNKLLFPLLGTQWWASNRFLISTSWVNEWIIQWLLSLSELLTQLHLHLASGRSLTWRTVVPVDTPFRLYHTVPKSWLWVLRCYLNLTPLRICSAFNLIPLKLKASGFISSSRNLGLFFEFILWSTNAAF